MGHSTIEMTLKIYTQLDNEKNDKDYFDKINNLFNQTKNQSNVSQTRKYDVFAEKQNPLKRSVQEGFRW